jgi:hypothetical protein
MMACYEDEREDVLMREVILAIPYYLTWPIPTLASLRVIIWRYECVRFERWVPGDWAWM